jgi:hypothetical protein
LIPILEWLDSLKDYSRKEASNAKSALKKAESELPQFKMKIVEMKDHMNIALTTEESFKLMSTSLLCPILPGDCPYQHRFYDVLAAGCLPLVHVLNDEHNCMSYWMKKANPNCPTPGCIDKAFPIIEGVDWRDLIVEISDEDFFSGKLTQFLLSLDILKLIEKREKLLSVRRIIMYDKTGETCDAFCNTMNTICTLM